MSIEYWHIIDGRTGKVTEYALSENARQNLLRGEPIQWYTPEDEEDRRA